MLKEKVITLTDNGNPIQFKIRQLTATQQEELIVKALLLLANKEVAMLMLIKSVIIRKD